jgi:type III secretory pathway component EscU
MIKGIDYMYAIDHSKLRESKTLSSLRNLQNLFSSKGLVEILASWFSVLM